MLEVHARLTTHGDANPMSENEDRWYVEIAGKVEMMSLDELVEAYEAGTISAKTLVTEVGESEWHTLAEVADLPEEEEPAPQSVRLPSPPTPVRAAPPASFPPASRESAWPPAATWASQAPAPVRSAPPSVAPPSYAPLSTAPVAHDLDLSGLDDMAFKRSKGKTAMIALAAVAVLGAGGFGILRASSAQSVAAVPVPAAAPLAGPSPGSLGDWKTPLNPVPAPANPAPAAEEEKPSDGSRLSEDTKAALAAKDKDTAAKKKAAAKPGRATRTVSRRSSDTSSGVFRSGGSADDPLNSKL
jgi:hypothetical protein